MQGKLRELGWTAADLAALAEIGRGGRGTSADVDRELTYLEGCEQEPAGPLRQAIADTMRRSWTRRLPRWHVILISMLF